MVIYLGRSDLSSTQLPGRGYTAAHNEAGQQLQPLLSSTEKTVDARLQKLIADYQASVHQAVGMLEAAGIPRPASNLEWVLSVFPKRGDLPGGFRYLKHGHGCSVVGPALKVDFDFGVDGRIDGFDAHRLCYFAGSRLKKYGFSSSEDVEAAVKDAHDNGDLIFSGHILFYVSAVPA